MECGGTRRSDGEYLQQLLPRRPCEESAAADSQGEHEPCTHEQSEEEVQGELEEVSEEEDPKAMLLRTDVRKSVHQKMMLPVHTPLTLITLTLTQTRETIKHLLVLPKLSLCLGPRLVES